MTMSEPPLQKIEVSMESEANKKAKSFRTTRRHSSGVYSMASQSPLRSIRRRSMKYESLGSPANRSSLSNTVEDDFKENNSPKHPGKNNVDMHSPSTLHTDVPIHPLQFSIQGSDDTQQNLASRPGSTRTPSSIGKPLISSDQKPKPPIPNENRFTTSSPDTSLENTPNKKYRSLSERKLMNRNEPPLSVIGSSPVLSSRQRSITVDESLRSTSILGKLNQSSLNSESNPSDGFESSMIFPNNCNDGGNATSSRNVTKQTGNRHDSFQQIISYNRSGNELHTLCSSMNSIDDLLRAQSLLFGISLNQASQRDYKGETTLHAFSNNKGLAAIIGNPNNEDFETKNFLTLYRQPSIDQCSADQLKCAVENFLVEHLLPSFFGAPIAQDNDGQLPFEAGLIDWVSTCHKEMYGVSPQSDHGYFSAYTNKVSDAVTQAWETTQRAIGRPASKSQRGQSIVPSDLERGDSTSSTSSAATLAVGKCKFTPHARFCLRMLSTILDEFEKFTEGFKTMGMNQQMEKHSRAIKGIQQLENVTGPLDLCGRVIEKIASIPYLLEVIFSINNESDLEFVLSTKIIKKVLIDKHSVGPWLTNMLQSPQSHISKRAIEYIEKVSTLCSGKQSDEKKDGTEESKAESANHEDLIEEVSRLHDFIPSLLALEEKVVEEVSTTLIVKEVMDRIIAQPFVATVVFCDAIFLFLMIVGFRAAVNGMIMGGQLDNVLRWIYVANTGIFYFIIAEIGKFVSLFLLSKNARNYFLSFWNLIDLLAILLAALSSVTMRWQFTIGEEADIIKDDSYLRGLLAVTTGFLWLRVLNFLKAINMQLATFVLAILQITKDIFWFCMILLTMVIAFSQMFFTLMAPPTCATGDLSGRQCQQSEYLLSVYTILLGDFGLFSRDDFASNFSVLLVVVYSFLVTVVLLNVLIAIASDSYEKCLLKSQKLFGRARVMLIAELASFQSLLRRTDSDSDSLNSPLKGIVYSKFWTSSGSNNWSRGSVLFFWLTMVVTVCWTFAELVGYVRGVQVGSIVMSFASVFINIALYIIIMIFLDRSSATTSTAKNEPTGISWSISYQKGVHWVLGVSRRSQTVSSRFSRGQDAWHGRVEFLQREMDRNTERQKELVMAQSECLQSLVNSSETRVRTEINNIDEKFKFLEASVQEELKGTREVNASILSAVNELRVLIALADGSNSGKSSIMDIPSEVDVGQVKKDF